MFAEERKKGNRYGTHRVLEPEEALPQSAARLDNRFDEICDKAILACIPVARSMATRWFSSWLWQAKYLPKHLYFPINIIVWHRHIVKLPNYSALTGMNSSLILENHLMQPWQY